MPSPRTRRRVLRTATALASTLAGCSSAGDGSTPDPDDPDAGTDSYGILARNLSGTTYGLGIEVTRTWEDEVVFGETIELDGGDEREWDGVITGAGEWSVIGRVDDHGAEADSDGLRLGLGDDDAPDVANVRVIVDNVEVQNGLAAVVDVTYEGEHDG
ncbi:hypothetical protein [Halorarum salinum]|uniref:Uncharacterized protein n=1 Tax=Halorarum salinum TaxID=2743089 RepID=A0A7D5LCX6_9EURY|nr:hypothetical protein [Halobaculum salinum]QLG63873.1 hypothetical protein HUG12_19970 [Halobaculum salinum]